MRSIDSRRTTSEDTYIPTISENVGRLVTRIGASAKWHNEKNRLDRRLRREFVDEEVNNTDPVYLRRRGKLAGAVIVLGTSLGLGGAFVMDAAVDTASNLVGGAKVDVMNAQDECRADVDSKVSELELPRYLAEEQVADCFRIGSGDVPDLDKQYLAD